MCVYNKIKYCVIDYWKSKEINFKKQTKKCRNEKKDNFILFLWNNFLDDLLTFLILIS